MSRRLLLGRSYTARMRRVTPSNLLISGAPVDLCLLVYVHWKCRYFRAAVFSDAGNAAFTSHAAFRICRTPRAQSERNSPIRRGDNVVTLFSGKLHPLRDAKADRAFGPVGRQASSSLAEVNALRAEVRTPEGGRALTAQRGVSPLSLQRRLRIHLQRLFRLILLAKHLAMHRQRSPDPDWIDQMVALGVGGVGVDEDA